MDQEELNTLLDLALQEAELSPVVAEATIESERYYARHVDEKDVEKEKLWSVRLEMEELVEHLLSETEKPAQAIVTAVEEVYDRHGKDGSKAVASQPGLQDLLEADPPWVERQDLMILLSEASMLVLYGTEVKKETLVVLSIDKDALPADMEEKMIALLGEPVGGGLFQSLLNARVVMTFPEQEETLIADQVLYAASALHVQYGMLDPDSDTLKDLAAGMKEQMASTLDAPAAEAEKPAAEAEKEQTA